MRPLLAVVLLSASVRQAQGNGSGNAAVSATIQAVEALSVSNGATITLSGTAGSDTLAGPSDGSALLNFSHNSATPLRITAEVLPGNVPAGQDLTLTVSVAGGAGAQTLLLSGAAQGAKNIYTNMAAGAYANRVVTYAASCTAGGTRVSADTIFDVIVTFTSLN